MNDVLKLQILASLLVSIGIVIGNHSVDLGISTTGNQIAEDLSSDAQTLTGIHASNDRYLLAPFIPIHKTNFDSGVLTYLHSPCSHASPLSFRPVNKIASGRKLAPSWALGEKVACRFSTLTLRAAWSCGATREDLKESA